MRPDVLNPLFAAITSLPGIGSKVERLYRRLLGRDEAVHVLDDRADASAATMSRASST